MNNRLVVKIAGESGQGINSIGEVLTQALKEVGLYAFGYREYPSLIRGGHASHQVDVSTKPVNAPSKGCDLLVCQSRVSFHEYYQSVHPNGLIMHSIGRMDLHEEEEAYFAQNKIQVVFVDAAKLAIESGGKRLMSNTILVGVMWKVLGLDLMPAAEVMKRVFAHKPQYIEVNLACLQTGYNQELPTADHFKLKPTENAELKDSMLITGNHAISLGALAAGVRALFAYPMTPSSSILSYLASVQDQTGMVVKQADDEIAAAQMALGAMHMGTRALTATSGGGFDLMTETVSLAGITETPFVCVLAQRPGPATGLPTWTSAGDLMLAIYAGHGEFARIVMAVDDARSGYQMTQVAFDLAEMYQVPVILMTEKQIAESWFQLQNLPENIPIKRGLMENPDQAKPTDRYKLTDNGVSFRWLPSQSDTTYVANSDEHLEDGSLTEAAEPAAAMYSKRLRKLETIAAILPEPELFGPEEADISLVGWGSVKQTILDAFAIASEDTTAPKCNYLHYSYLYPLKTETFTAVAKRAKRLVITESNATAQLGKLITQETGVQFKERFLKFDGRPFFVEEVLSFIRGEK